MKNILALFSGSIFGLGLTISSMTNPDKVLGFLDLFNNWDPSLAFVMGGAIIISAPMLFVLTKNKNLVLSKEIHLPTNKEIDKKLIIGSLIFGLGWGLVGLCPGPAISSLALLEVPSIIFVIFMFIGFYCSKFIKI
tara:strand:- start:951 stop:1358 length:408 start_codon:yes stop_codon:yes gene_type:complete